MAYVVSHVRKSGAHRAETKTLAEAVRLAVELARERNDRIEVTDPNGVTRSFDELQRAVFNGDLTND
jgi:hypothetical protein